MLKTLDDFPKPHAIAKLEISTMTRVVVHEIGHIVAAAAVGIPTDYLVIDVAIGALRHGGYIGAAYRTDLNRNHLARIRILAAGFEAERALFGAADLSISTEDLRTIANILRFPENNDWMTARCVVEHYHPVLPQRAVTAIKTIYPKIVLAMDEQHHLLDCAHVIPFSVFADPPLQVSEEDRQRADDRTKDARNRELILATLRAGVRSGV